MVVLSVFGKKKALVLQGLISYSFGEFDFKVGM